MQNESTDSAGSSYIPYQPEPFKLDLGGGPAVEQPEPPAPIPQQTPQVMEHAFSRKMRDSAKGQASEINDFDLTMSGIAYGDPIGMETFDLGFFDDGTPAIVINGANVPIRHDQWMALMNMRNKTRDEVRARMEYQAQLRKANDAISKVKASVNLPQGMAPIFEAYAQIDPPGAMKYLTDVYRSMQATGGSDLMGKMRSDIQKVENENAIGFLLRPQGKQSIERPPTYPGGPPTIETVFTPSIRDQRVAALSKSQNSHDQITAHAYMTIEDFLLDPTYRQANPTARIGVFDRIARQPDRFSQMSMFSRLQHLAAYNQEPGWAKIPIVQPPVMMATTAWIGASVAQQARYLDYLQRLDQWAASVFRYDQSNADIMQMMLLEQSQVATSEALRTPDPTVATPSQGSQQAQRGQQPGQPQRSGRPSATR